MADHVSSRPGHQETGAISDRESVASSAEVEARNWKKFPTLLFRRSIKNLNLSDFNYTKQVDGQIMLREREDSLVWRIGIEKQGLPRKSRKGLPRN